MTTEKKFQYELVYIAGEGVSFVPTGLASNETIIVEFEPYYRPNGLSDEQFQHLKQTMRNLFDGKVKGDGLSSSLPPCSPDEKQMVLQSLLHRKSVLFQQLYDLGIHELDEIKDKVEHIDELNTKETLLVRTHLLHFLELNKLITSYKEAQTCINLEDIVYGSKQKDFDEDALRELLKQFVFFLLQSSHPLKEYTNTNVKAPEFVARLEKNPIGEKFTPFLETYKTNKFSIPPMIAKVLEATDLDSNAMAEKVKEEITLEKEAIVTKIKELIPPTDPFWTSILAPTDPVSIVEQLHTQGVQAIDTIKRLEVEKSALETSMKTCEQAKKALQAEKATIEKKVAELEEELLEKGGNENDLQQLREQLASLQTDYEGRIARLTEQGRVYLEEKQRYEARILEFTTANTQLQSQIGELQERVRQLEEIQTHAQTNIDALKQRHMEELQAEKEKVVEKEEALAAAQQVVESTRQEKDSAVEELATSKVKLEEAKRIAIEKDAAIAALRKSLGEQETREETLRNELAAKTEEAVRLQSEITGKQASIEELNDGLEELYNRLGEAEGEKQGIDDLQASLLEKENEVRDLQTQLDQCNADKERLRGEVAAPAQEIARLGVELDTANEERDEALSQQQELTTTIESLRAQLAQETSSKETLGKKLEDTDAALQLYKNNNEKLKAEVLRSKQELAETTTSLEQQFGDELAKAKEGLESELAKGMDDIAKEAREEKTRIQEEADAKLKAFEKKVEGLDETIKWYEEHAKIDEEERKQVQKSLEVVRQIASAIDSGGTIPTIPTGIPQEETTALSTILQSLTKKMETQTKPTESASADICYVIFFASFLWRIHFPGWGDNTVKVFFTNLFSKGSKGKSPVITTVITSDKLIDSTKPSAPQIMRKYLILLNKLAQAMSPSKDGTVDGAILGITDTEINYITLLQTKVKVFIADIPMTESKFLTTVLNELLAKQPSINPELLTKYVVLHTEPGKNRKTPGKTSVKIQKSDTPSDTPSSVLSYPVLFYSFLMIMRDYLNTIKTESLVQCPLPEILSLAKQNQ